MGKNKKDDDKKLQTDSGKKDVVKEDSSQVKPFRPVSLKYTHDVDNSKYENKEK